MANEFSSVLIAILFLSPTTVLVLKLSLGLTLRIILLLWSLLHGKNMTDLFVVGVVVVDVDDGVVNGVTVIDEISLARSIVLLMASVVSNNVGLTTLLHVFGGIFMEGDDGGELDDVDAVVCKKLSYTLAYILECLNAMLSSMFPLLVLIFVKKTGLLLEIKRMIA